MCFKNFARAISTQIRKGVAIDVFHRDAGRLRVLHEIVDPHDVLVRELKAAFGFAF